MEIDARILTRAHLRGPTARSVAFLLLGASFLFALGLIAARPITFPDEALYSGAARSLAAGRSPQVAGAPLSVWTYGPIYLLLIAPIYRAAPTLHTAYLAVRGLNALLFTSAAAPIFLVASRSLTRRSASFVALAGVALPASVYTTKLQTESLAYPVTMWVVLSVLYVIEAPTRRRQFTLLAFLAIAPFVRFELLVLIPAVLAATLILAKGSMAARLRRQIVLSAGAIAGGGAMVAAIAVSAARGVSDHHGLSVQYITAPGLLRQFAGLLAALDLSTGVAPFAIFIAVIVASRKASTSSWMRSEIRSLAVVTASLSVGLAIFGSLYLAGIPPRWRPSPPPDRYVFYVLPLILTLFAGWIEVGAPVTKALRFTGPITATLPVVVGAAEVREHGFAATSNSLGYMPWMFVRFVIPGATWLVVLAGYCSATAALVIASRVHTRRLVRIVSASIVVSTLFAFGYVGLGSLNAARHSPPVGWLDARTNGRVVGVWLRPPTDRQAFALWETQAMNRNLYRVYYVTGPDQLGPEAKLEQALGGELLDNGTPVNARYALTSSTTPIVGRLVAQRNGLALYKIRPPLRIAVD